MFIIVPYTTLYIKVLAGSMAVVIAVISAKSPGCLFNYCRSSNFMLRPNTFCTGKI